MIFTWPEMGSASTTAPVLRRMSAVVGLAAGVRAVSFCWEPGSGCDAEPATAAFVLATAGAGLATTCVGLRTSEIAGLAELCGPETVVVVLSHVQPMTAQTATNTTPNLKAGRCRSCPATGAGELETVT